MVRETPAPRPSNEHLNEQRVPGTRRQRLDRPSSRIRASWRCFNVPADDHTTLVDVIDKTRSIALQRPWRRLQQRVVGWSTVHIELPRQRTKLLEFLRREYPCDSAASRPGVARRSDCDQ